MTDSIEFDVDSPETGDEEPTTITVSSAELNKQVDHVVAKLLQKQIETIAAVQFEQLLTPEVYVQIAELTSRRLEESLKQEIFEAQAAIEAAENPPTTVFGSVEEFVREQLSPSFRRDVQVSKELRWCPCWWEHAEAISRLEALWRSWEHLRQDAATGMSVWWRDHADHHMSVLMSPTGPFSRCDAIRGHHSEQNALVPLPLAAAPAAMFPDTRQ